MTPLARTLALAALTLTFSLSAAPTRADDSNEIDLDDIVRKPEIGNYKGYAEFKMAHYDNARRIWEALDARNFGEAAFNLGILYEDGLGVPRDIARALAYYRRGADNGSVKAAFRIGKLYWFGAPGIARDEAAGRRYLALAAAAGDGEAARYLAATAAAADTAVDPLTEADRAEAAGRLADAAAILEVAANKGNAVAQTRLAWLHESGRGVERNLERAAEWFMRAASAGNGEAMYALAVMHATGAGRPRDAAISRQWLERSAAAGYPQAIRELNRQ